MGVSLSHDSEHQQIVSYFSQNEVLDLDSRPWLAGVVNRYQRSEPPIVNRIGGEGRRFRMSPYGRKLLNIPDIAPILTFKPVARPISTPRNEVLAAINSSPKSASSIAAITGIDVQSVHHHLRKLEDKGLLLRQKSPADGRVTLYGLRPSLVEPPKPVLTPSLVPLTDETNPATWFERMAIAHMCGEAFTEPGEEESSAAMPQIVERQRLPRVLVISGKTETIEERLHEEFKSRLKIKFWNSGVTGSAAGLREQLIAIDKIFLCTLRTNHSIQFALRRIGKFERVRGGWEQLRVALEKYASARK